MLAGSGFAAPLSISSCTTSAIAVSSAAIKAMSSSIASSAAAVTVWAIVRPRRSPRRGIVARPVERRGERRLQPALLDGAPGLVDLEPPPPVADHEVRMLSSDRPSAAKSHEGVDRSRPPVKTGSARSSGVLSPRGAPELEAQGRLHAGALAAGALDAARAVRRADLVGAVAHEVRRAVVRVADRPLAVVF